jgi:FAD/FMN-containing dehydrogenase
MRSRSIPLQTRRTFLAQALAGAGLLSLSPVHSLVTTNLVVANVTGLYSVEVARIETPTTAPQVAAMVRGWSGRVAVGGGRYSMGGQVACRGGLHLDMRAMNKLVWIRPEAHRVRVQAGMRWRELQDILDPLDLAVKTMQSYANFTVGGSISVNAHGRYVGHGPVGNTVQALQLVLADGAIIEAGPHENTELFRAAIGGYGAAGVIVEVELELADNVRIERRVDEVPLERYVQHFEQFVLSDPASVLHNADLLPPAFDAPVCVTWRTTAKPLTESARLVPHGQRYGLEQNAIWVMTELPGGQRLRKSVVHPLLTRKPAIKRLNHEASLDVAGLEPRTRSLSTYVLQEYFVPKRNFLVFAQGLAVTLGRFKVEALNVSIRHSPADRVSLLPWAGEDVFCFVLYHKQRTHAAAIERVGRWTRELIDLALANEGRYYLPYQPHATQEQFERAYPEAAALRTIKQKVDPGAKFSNEMWARYL